MGCYHLTCLFLCLCLSFRLAGEAGRRWVPPGAFCASSPQRAYSCASNGCVAHVSVSPEQHIASQLSLPHNLFITLLMLLRPLLQLPLALLPIAIVVAASAHWMCSSSLWTQPAVVRAAQTVVAWGASVRPLFLCPAINMKVIYSNLYFITFFSCSYLK
jgi:hypothetical protein